MRSSEFERYVVELIEEMACFYAEHAPESGEEWPTWRDGFFIGVFATAVTLGPRVWPEIPDEEKARLVYGRLVERWEAERGRRLDRFLRDVLGSEGES